MNKTNTIIAIIVGVIAIITAFGSYHIYMNKAHASAEAVAYLYGRWEAKDKLDLQKKIWQLEDRCNSSSGCTAKEQKELRELRYQLQELKEKK